MAAEWVRVSDVLSWAFPKDFPLHPYYLRRGTYVHKLCAIVGQHLVLDTEHESYALGLKEHQMPFSSGKTERWVDYLDCYQDWYVERPSFLVELIDGEYEVRNEIELYTGHPDQLWRLSDGREAILDLKTGTAPKSTRLQTAAYDLGQPHEKRRRRFALQLRPDEKAKLTEYTDSRDYAVWRLLVRAFHVVNSGEYR